MKRPAAFTLLEVLIAMGCAALLLTILLRVSGATYRIGHAEIERGALEGRALLVARRLETDLLNTSPAAVSLSADGSRLLMQPVQGLSSTKIVFEEMFVYWNCEPIAGSEMKRLTRSEILARPDSQPFGGAAFRWSPAQIASLPAGPSNRVTVTVDGVTSFAVKNPAGVVAPQVGSPLSFELEIAIPLATTRKTLRIDRTVLIRTSVGL